MKGKTKLKYRVLSAVMAVLMAFTMLPASIITYATQSGSDSTDVKPDVYVRWQPAEESAKTGETATVNLSASLNSDSESIVESAEVKISLTRQEASALQQFRDENGKLDYETEVLSGEGTAINIELKDDGGVNICFTLDNDNPTVTSKLTFKSWSKTTAPFSIDVSDDDITISPTLKKGAAGEPVLQKKGGSCQIDAFFNWEMAAEAKSENVKILNGGVSDFAFNLLADSQNKAETGVIYTQIQTFKVTLKLPEGVYLPEGDYSYLPSNGQITADGASVASITGLPADAKVRNVVCADISTLEFEIVRTPEAFTEITELPDLDCEIMLLGSALTLRENDISKDDARVSLSVQMDAVSLAGDEYTCQGSAQADISVYIESEKAENSADALYETTASAAQKATRTAAVQNGLISAQSSNNTVEVYANEPEYIRIDSYREAYSQRIFWVDNNNETGIRPSADKYTAPKLYFSMDGGGFKELTKSNLADLGLSNYPSISIDARSGVGSYTLSIGSNTLPTQVTYVDKYGDETSHTVEWKITPQQTDGYSLVEVTPDNLSEYQGISQTGWYYILNFDFSFYLRMRWGNLGQAPGISNAILEHFQFVASIRGTTHDYKLSDIDDAIDIVIDPSSDPDNPTSGTMIINDVWKYNIDGSQISYSVEEIKGGGGRITIPSLDKGDYFVLSYDNSAAPNFGSVTDKIHSGGTMYLTLTGIKNYSADKVWLDGGSDEIKTGRPTGEFQLWRYRSGSSYTTAAPVRNVDGTIVTTTLDIAQNSQNISHEALTKYDPEGYEYIYVAREYLDATTVNGEDARSYEQVFGSVSEDGTITDRVDVDGELVDTTEPRPNGNTFLYDGGTISNRITDTVAASATKVWKAAAFQSEFEDIKIELILQSRVRGSNDEWNNTGEKEVIDGFFAENLSYTVSRNMPEYDMLGRALEYRWIEQAVYQGEGSTDNLLTWLGDSGSFTLKQSDRDIKYSSVSEIQGDNSTLITNSIANTIDYETIKVWLDADGEEIDAPDGADATFNIYRTISGEALGEPVAAFTMDGIADEDKTLVNEELGIYAQETEPWVTVVTPLDEYDGEGRQYEYVLLEVSGNIEFIPTYETTRDDDGYTTTVYNAPGKGNRIMVRKAWIDDSDILHRQPVTITVYNRYTNEIVNSITLGNGVWHDWVGIGNLEQEDVYILETKVGETAVPLTSYVINSGSEPNYTSPQMPDEYNGESDDEYTAIQYQTEYHYYEATYSREEIAGITFYTVTNRRLGNINLTVTKNWVDGDGEKRQEIQAELERLSSKGVTLYPALRLKFAEDDVPSYYEISRSGVGSSDYITVGNHDNRVPILDGDGQNASSDREIILTEDTSEYKFFGLPKYDRNGSVVRYEVVEIWLDGNGAVVDIETIAQSYPELYELIKEYNVGYEETGYTVGHKHEADSQSITVTNRLSGTKSIMWHKQWNDDYVYSSGQRPDIYLNIYNEVHTSDIDTAVSLYIANYKWTYLEEDPADDPDGLYDKQLHWHAVLDGLPKYDSLGYEIKYFAVEHTSVNASDFDYLPVEYSVPVAENEGHIASIGTEYEISSPDGMNYVRNVQTQENSDVPYYALIEGGTFTNKIYQTVTIRGQKLWTSLPSGYPRVDLPTVKFTLYQQTAGSSDKKSIATLEVSDWASIYSNGSYIFRIEYIGKNTMTVDPDGNVIISGEEGASKLPKYDGRGRIYNYVLEESSISWPNGDSPDNSDVYRDPAVNTYLISNTYDSIKGALSVKKYLYLPLDENGLPKAYPAINFELSRTYTKSDGSTSIRDVVEYIQWSSAEVKAAYEANKEAVASGGGIEKVLTFENLEIYAPNGSEYNYTVTEVKDYLGGYDTWASAGDIAEDDIDGILTADNMKDSVSSLAVTLNSDDGRGETSQSVAIAATFVNAPRDIDRETVILTGTKTWRDFDDAFQIRPQDISITLSRYANAQPGQGNQIAEAVVDESTYKISWDKTDKKTWKYTIEGTAANELDAYAPNGMPWEYVVTERLPDGSVYTSSPANGRVGEKSQTDSEITMNNLTNSILTSASYSKSFVDTDGKIISEDYLGFDISVSFELQVAELNGSNIGQWQSASDYFDYNLSDEIYNAVFGGYSFTQSLTGRINDTSVWGVSRSFVNLPKVIKKNGSADTALLTYRVVEKEIKYGDITQTVEVVNSADNKTYTYSFSAGLFSPAYWANGKTSAETDYNNSSTRNLYNRLQTTDLTLTKQWLGDNGNIYSTRPNTGRTGYDWEVSFIVQRSTDNINWENVKLFTSAGATEDLIVTLYGTDNDTSVSETVTGLPVSDMSGNAYIYRIRELQINFTVSGGSVSADDILSDDGDIYNTAYTVGYPSLDTATNRLNQTSVYAVKKWNPSSAKVNVTLELQYKGTDGAWKSFSRPAKVTLNGTADAQSAYYEYEAWKAVWSGVPQSLPGSDLSKDGKTQYRVVETVPSGYIIESSDVVEMGSGYPEYSFTNVEATLLSVEKKWYGVAGGEQKTVVAGLWRTTGEIDGQGAEKVLDGSGNQRTITLSSSNGYNGAFTSLPKYDAAGNEYKYYARELTIGGVPADEAGYRIVNTDASGKTVIANIGLMELIGSKTWKDNSNAYNTRPEEITLTLYRSIAGGDEMEVEASPTWQKDGNVWSYKYTGLPKTDDSGNAYTYRVEETVPENYTSSQDGNDITNTLTGTVDIPVTKVWKDGGNADGLRPDSVTVVLYANGTEVRRKEITGGNILNRLWRSITGSKDTWSYTFEDLPKYDSDGKLIEYTVKEIDVPDDYEVSIDGFTITNTLLTELTVEKIWGGVDGESQQEVTVGLYRTADEDTAPQEVLDADGEHVKISLNADNGWENVFTSLPRFDEQGNRYIYSVKELTIGGKPADDAGYIINISYGANGASISNIMPIDITGSKIWKDNSNAYDTRPEEITLTLYRSIAGGDEMEVEASPTWQKDGDVWSYKYTGLPKTDDSGNAYTYRVEETVPENYTSSQDGNDITNTLTGTVDIPVTKIWRDNDNVLGERPQTIEVVLYANGVEVASAEIGEDTGLIEGLWNKITGTADNKWEYVFEGVPKYDEDGVEIVYTVAEREVSEDYEVRYDGFEIENVKFGGLSVSKSVTGTAGDKDAYFNFIVELSDTSINGVYGEMKFVDGVAEFSLKDKESITATGLNADIEYTVTELEADKDGYATTSDSESGTIPAGDIAEASFINHKDAPPPSEVPSSLSQQSSTPSDASSDYSHPVDNVDTGDNSSLVIFAGLMIASLISMLSILVYNRKREG